MSSNLTPTELPAHPTDAISSVVFSPDNQSLLASAWDSAIHIYTRTPDSWQYSKKIECDAPILDVAWDSDNVTIYAVGLDQEVAKYNVQQGEDSRVVLSTHEKACNKVAYSAEHNLVISTSWDGVMHVHDPQSGNFVPMKLAGKPFALSLTQDKAVVVMAERKIHIYDLPALKTVMEQAGGTDSGRQPIESQPWQTRESSLKFMTRDVACMPDGTGFAISSIEGRVGVEWFDEEANQATYAFKCHREKATATDGEVGDVKTVDIIFPVNAVAFHPVHGTFATGGGDGVVILWDAKTKRRIRNYPKLPSSIAALRFSADGRSLAIGISPGFEDGKEEAEPDPALVKVYVRELGNAEAKSKAAKEKSSKEEA